MTFALRVASYIVALFVVMLAEWVAVLCGFALPFLPWRKVTAIPFRFLLDASSSLFGVLLVRWIAEHSSLSASRLMVIIPAGLIILNDLKRRAEVLRGQSPVKALFQAGRESGNYDQRWDFRMKTAELWAHLAGFSTGIFEVLKNAPFF